MNKTNLLSCFEVNGRCILQCGYEEGLAGWEQEGVRHRALLHHWAWHVAPALTAARFLHSPTTAGTVHPPDPASSSQNKLCFVPPPHPLAGPGSLYA